MKLSAAVVIAALFASLALAGGAEAASFCVGSTAGPCDVTKPATPSGLQAGLTEAAGNSEPDTVKIAGGTYSGEFTYQDPEEIDIDGSGTGVTVIHGSAPTAAALRLLASGSSTSTLSDLTVRKQTSGGSAVGLTLQGVTAMQVEVTEAAGTAGTGVRAFGDVKFLNGSIDAPDDHGFFDEFGSTNSISDSTVRARFGIGTAGGNLTVSRCHVKAIQEGISVGGMGATATVSNSVVRALGGSSSGLYSYTGGELTANHVTVAGMEANNGAYVSQTAAGSASLHLTNSTVTGFYKDLVAGAGGGGMATLDVEYSNYKAVEESGGANVVEGSGNVNVNPQFVDPSGGATTDFRLRHDSPLIDQGAPGAGAPTDLDLAKLGRVRDGDGSGGAIRRDMGAYEYQRRAPTAVLGGPDTGTAEQLLAFSAAGSTDPDLGDTLAYEWDFGDGSTATGEAPAHAFAAGGTYTVTLKVSDPTGRTATATHPVTIAALPALPAQPAQPAQGGGAAADSLAPAISGLLATNRVFRVGPLRRAAIARRRAPRGTTFRLTLSEAAGIAYRVERRARGRLVGRRCRKATRRNRTRRRCARWVAVHRFARSGQKGANTLLFSGRVNKGGRVRKLAAGRYRLVARATDAAGNGSASVRVPFRIVK